MDIFNYKHDEVDKYIEDNINAAFNIPTVLRLLAKQPMIISQLSALINTPERIARGRTIYNVYSIMEKMERWSYVKCEKNIRKYKSSYKFWVLTDEGREALTLMPTFLLAIQIKSNEIYKEYRNDGLIYK